MCIRDSDSVEKVTGTDFFPQLSDTVEPIVESTIDTVTWFPASNVNRRQYVALHSIKTATNKFFDLRGCVMKQGQISKNRIIVNVTLHGH
jgi:hypothetical protein